MCLLDKYFVHVFTWQILCYGACDEPGRPSRRKCLSCGDGDPQGERHRFPGRRREGKQPGGVRKEKGRALQETGRMFQKLHGHSSGGEKGGMALQGLLGDEGGEQERLVERVLVSPWHRGGRGGNLDKVIRQKASNPGGS